MQPNPCNNLRTVKVIMSGENAVPVTMQAVRIDPITKVQRRPILKIE